MKRFLLKILSGDPTFFNIVGLCSIDFLREVYKLAIKITKPNRLRKLETIRFVQINSFTLLCFDQYLGMRITSLGLKPFPWTLNYDKFHSLTQLPSKTCFQKVSDTYEEREKIDLYYESAKKRWRFPIALRATLMAQADYILEKVEKVQHIAHQVQSKTLEVYQDSFKEYSPFSFMRKVF